MSKQTIIINGNDFVDLETFYDEIDSLLTKNLDWKTGHNLDAFNDLLRGGFGVHDYEETIRLVWINFAKSKKDFDHRLLDRLIEIIKTHDHIDFSTID